VWSEPERLFFVVEDETLADSITKLIDGDTAPTRAPKAKTPKP